MFWKNIIKTLYKRTMSEYKIPSLLLYFDANSSGLASVHKEEGKEDVCYKNYSEV